MKKLYKSDNDKVLAGVLGGLGEYFNIDSVILRVIYIIITLIGHIFPAVIVYIIAALVIPKRPHHHKHHHGYNEK